MKHINAYYIQLSAAPRVLQPQVGHSIPGLVEGAAPLHTPSLQRVEIISDLGMAFQMHACLPSRGLINQLDILVQISRENSSLGSSSQALLGIAWHDAGRREENRGSVLTSNYVEYKYSALTKCAW